MNIAKTNRLSLVDQVVLQMESLIESGTWSVGTRVPPELELMQQFDVSRNTLREAIRALVHAGLLKTKQGSGTFVCSSSVLGAALHRRIQQSSILETLEVRHALEREAAQLAATRRNEDDLDRLRTCMAACQAAAEAENQRAYVEADIKLHKAIVKATHNSVLIDLYEHMTESLHTSVHQIVARTSPAGFHQMVHSKLVNAIIEQNMNQAIEAVNEYIHQFKEALTLDMGESS